MAQDYHIYIHGEGNGSSGSKTAPFSTQQENGKTSNFETAKQAFGTASSIAQGNGVNMGVAALSKAYPAIAIAVAIYGVVDKVLTTGFAHQREYTGNYKNEMNYNNFKAKINMAVNPIGFVIKVAHQRAQFNKQNKEIAQQNRLIGNSILKDFNMGV